MRYLKAFIPKVDLLEICLHWQQAGLLLDEVRALLTSPTPLLRG